LTSANKDTTKVFSRPQSLIRLPFAYCPGCGHGVIHRLLAEVIDEMGIAGKVVLVTSIGCSVRMWQHFRYDMCQAPHGRAPAVATGLRRALPSDRIIITYQGDGDLIAIGTAETIHAASRGENITILFVNNAIYGATGGQLAPTSLPGQITSTSPNGRDPALAGYPLKVCELLSNLEGTSYLVRVGIYDAPNIARARTAVKKALQYQINGKGFSMVEVLSPCPTNLHLNPVQANNWVREKMVPYFPLGEYKDKG
jgi:2-oxoglutarate ferredoxin oxidoreductase subunit beta